MFQKTDRKFILPIEHKEAFQELNERSLIEIKKKINEFGPLFLIANDEEQDQLFKKIVLYTMGYITLQQANKLLPDNNNLILSKTGKGELEIEIEAKHLSDILQATSTEISEENLKEISTLSLNVVANAILLNLKARRDADYYAGLVSLCLLVSVIELCAAVFATAVLAILSAEGVIPLTLFAIIVGSIVSAGLVGFFTGYIIEQFKYPYLKEDARFYKLLSDVNTSTIIDNSKLEIKINEICNADLLKNSMFRTKLDAIYDSEEGKLHKGLSIAKLRNL